MVNNLEILEKFSKELSNRIRRNEVFQGACYETTEMYFDENDEIIDSKEKAVCVEEDYNCFFMEDIERGIPLNKLRKISLDEGIEIMSKSPISNVEINIRETKEYTNLSLRFLSGKQVSFDSEWNVERIKEYEASYTELKFYKNGCTFFRKKEGRKPLKMPLDMFHIHLMTQMNKMEKLFSEFLLSMLSEYPTLYLFQDFRKEYDFLSNEGKKNILVPSIAFSDIFVFLNKKDWIESKIANKHRGTVFCNWNKRSFLYSYSLIKCLPHVLPEEKNLLSVRSEEVEKRLQQNNNYYTYRTSDFVRNFLLAYYLEKFKKISINQHIIEDWINMLLDEKIKIPLSYGYHKICKEHDELAFQNLLNFQNIKDGEIPIKKNSRFDFLRKNIPNDWEDIHTVRRLYEEGVAQHNCVFGYLEKIEEDECAIISVKINGTRYTLEICERSSRKIPKYGIEQMEKTCNRGHKEEDYKIVSQIISSINLKRKKNVLVN